MKIWNIWTTRSTMNGSWVLNCKEIEKPLHYRSKNLDAKFWIQKLILKKYSKKVNHFTYNVLRFPLSRNTKYY